MSDMNEDVVDNEDEPLGAAVPDIPVGILPDLNHMEGTYLERLYAMLDQCSPAIASWTPNGTAFVVYDVEALEATVLPQFFKPIKFASFVQAPQLGKRTRRMLFNAASAPEDPT
ncbi:hypothetical protein H257_11429 [Aphanomyces astaci]|uniref:HSF-type DNA-binding domain-containing protein n=1 Tax=Aphanomyces astaci TaxID=112090 RepID=W4G3V4_APHAT|nr:hypothetical protein H257_11429 [Aphanomyces astaci]ETV73714.1 hypothetical protein H257_11429 [Aphanomyces astaci]|eukprot:XP_009836650.1 hypothetical protein H257_11429 [Aphanomyces astaci]